MRIIAFLFMCYCCRLTAATFSLHVKNDTTISFEVYTPGLSLNDLKTKPAFFFFDPGGYGAYPLQLYESLARKYDFVLIGANFSRNGLPFDSISTNFTTA